LDDLIKRVKKLKSIGLLSHVSPNPDVPVENEIADTNTPETVILLHIEAQTYLLLEILDMLGNINEKMAMMNINIQDVEQALLASEDEMYRAAGLKKPTKEE
jgi:hypothetical protein